MAWKSPIPGNQLLLQQVYQVNFTSTELNGHDVEDLDSGDAISLAPNTVSETYISIYQINRSSSCSWTV